MFYEESGCFMKRVGVLRREWVFYEESGCFMKRVGVL